MFFVFLFDGGSAGNTCGYHTIGNECIKVSNSKIVSVKVKFWGRPKKVSSKQTTHTGKSLKLKLKESKHTNLQLKQKRIFRNFLLFQAFKQKYSTTKNTIRSIQIELGKIITCFIINMAYSWDNRVDFVVRYMYGKLVFYLLIA